MPLSANFRREMLMAIKNAKKKKEGDETQNDDEDTTSDIVRYNSKILAKPAISRRDLHATETPISGQSASVETAQGEEKVSKK